MNFIELDAQIPDIIVRDIGVSKGENSTIYSCDIGNDGEEIIWYEMPSGFSHNLEYVHYAFTLAAVAIGMQKGANVYVEYSVDSRFVKNIREYIDIWSSWCPKTFFRISLKVAIEQDIPLCSNREKGVMCFSGGVDGCATLRANIDNPDFRKTYPIGAGVLVHGFDVPLDSVERFSWLTKSCERILGSENIPLHTVRTNWRKLIPNWRYTHGIALASCLWLFAEEFEFGVIASGDDSYNNLVHGSNPFTDRLLSGAIFKVVSHGGSMTRIEKIQLIYQWSAAIENLNVCWANRKGHGNCGKCEKCVRTKLYFYIFGNSPPESLPTQDIVSEIQCLENLDDLRLRIWKSIIELAMEKGKDRDDWFYAAYKKVKISERRARIAAFFSNVKNRWYVI